MALLRGLGLRSGYELRVIGYMDDIWIFASDDKLTSCALALDTYKRKYADMWTMLVEENLHPSAAADVIVHTIYREHHP